MSRPANISTCDLEVGFRVQGLGLLVDMEGSCFFVSFREQGSGFGGLGVKGFSPKPKTNRNLNPQQLKPSNRQTPKALTLQLRKCLNP